MFNLELEITKEQMQILYDFTKNTNLADLHDRFGDKFCSDDLYAIDCILDNIYRKYEKDFR